MKKNTKKKVLTLALVIALLAIAVVGGSLAWFTAEDEATNTFTVGSIKVEQLEQQHDEDGNLVKFDNDKVLLPIVNTANPSYDENYQEKIVSVKNTGKNDAYVRTHIAIPSSLMGYLCLDTKEDNWTYENISGTTVGGIDYTVFTYHYKYAIVENEETDVLLYGVYLDPRTDVQKNLGTGNMEFCRWNEETGRYDFTGFAVEDGEGTTYKVNVLVATQAVQADGFPDALTALNNAFGTIPGAIPDFSA